MSNISIFARGSKPHHDGHLHRVSSNIRAWQIAEYIGAKLNPKDGYENDVCIYVKPHVKPGHDFRFEGKPYLDIVDGWNLIHLLERYPQVPVIVCSQADFETLSHVIRNKIVLIAQHHCNFERITRKRESITTVGCIGSPKALSYLPHDLKSRLKERKIELKEFSRFIHREDIVNFYTTIDIQIVWRPYMDRKISLSNPLKLVNAASFGIPTIALEEPAFAEMKDCYLPVRSLDEFLQQLDTLRSSPSLYAEYSQRCLKKAEAYHIEHIAKLYQQLN